MISKLFSKALAQKKEKMWQWVDAKRPPSKTHTLNRNNLFIFPSRQGLWFLIANLILWLVGTNYENNLILAFAFLLTTVFVMCILHTFANLSGLSIQFLSVKPVFSGDSAEISLLVSRQGKRGRDNIQLYWPGNLPTVISLINDQEVQVKVIAATRDRGWFKPGRLIVDSVFPLGIIRCWTRIDLDSPC